MSLVKFQNATVPAFTNLFDDLFGKDPLICGTESPSTIPAVNIKENDSQFTLEVAAPGLSKEDFKLKVDYNRLIVKSESKASGEESTEIFSRKEFGYSGFKRTFTLPKHVDVNGITAEYKNGVLIVNVPRLKEEDNDKIRNISIA